MEKRELHAFVPFDKCIGRTKINNYKLMRERKKNDLLGEWLHPIAHALFSHGKGKVWQFCISIFLLCALT
jgi:hypothetical protein